MIGLATPLALLLAPVPLLARYLPARAEGTIRVPDGVAAGLVAGGAGTRGRRPAWLLWSVWVLAVLALAGPRQLLDVRALAVSGRDLAIVLDLSGSMVREDFDLDGRIVTRLDAVREVGAAFARGRAGDRVALILFGSDAYYAAPFTFDTEAVAQRIEAAEIGISGRATNISDGLGLALKRMATSDAESRVAILLSDGVNNAGATEPRGVAELAATMGVRVHTIALGPRDLAEADEGERGVVDAATLAAVAELSGGTAFRVRTTDDLAQVMDAIDGLEPTDTEGLAAEIWRPLWIWPAALAGALALVATWREAGP